MYSFNYYNDRYQRNNNNPQSKVDRLNNFGSLYLNSQDNGEKEKYNRLSHSYNKVNVNDINKMIYENDFSKDNYYQNLLNEDKKPKGLSNIGATCYMNATLQCFYHVKKLTEYLINKKYYIDSISIKQNSITYAYLNLINELYNKNGKEYIEPYEFKDILSKNNPLFKGIAANDSKDLILYLEEALHDELKIKKNIGNDFNRNINLDQRNENAILTYFIKDFSKETSIIKDLFHFITKTKTFCQNCKNIIFNFQTNNFLIFPLQKIYNESTNNTKSNSYNNIFSNNINMINSNIYGNNLNINQNNNYYNNIFNNNNNNIYQNYNNNLIGNENLRNPSNEINNYYNYNLYKNDNNNLFNSKLNKDSKGNKNKDNLNHFNRSPNIRIYNNNNRKDIIYNNIFSRDKNKIDNKYKNKYNNRFLLGSGPPKGNFPMSYKTQILSNKPKLNLYQCFESFSKPEILSGENQQYCNSCNQMSNATYITTIYSTCNILILILNYGKGILFECDVDFDEYIDISKYVQQTNISPVKYRLLGIIVHIGPSSMSGHFIAYCRQQDNSWYKFNDSIVSKATFNEIKNSNGIPYVFFYENANPY